jgi:hypothetical protein
MNRESWRSPWARRLALGGLGVAAALFVLFAFAPARQAAAQFLQLFRVGSGAVVPISEQRMQQLEGLEGALESGLLGRPTTLREPEEPRSVADLAEASTLAGYPVRSPSYLPEGMARRELAVATGPALRLDMSRTQMAAILEQAGITDVELPPVEELSVAVDVGRGVMQSYAAGPVTGGDRGLVGNGAAGGDVGGDAAGQGGLGSDEASTTEDGVRVFGQPAGRPGARVRRVFNPHFELFQVPRPALDLPEGVDPAVLGSSLLQLFGIPQADAGRLARTIDWTSTLVLPVPAGAARFREVPVDGVVGVMVDSEERLPEREQAVLWQKDGIVYGIAGRGVDLTELVRVADSLR